MTKKRAGTPKGSSNRTQDSSSADERRMEITLLSIPRDWEVLWSRFLGAHRGWWDRYQSAGPVYLLPAEVINQFYGASRGDARHHSRRVVLSAEDAAAENAFRQICKEYERDIVGVWGDQPIPFDLLSPPLPASTIRPEWLDGWSSYGVSPAMVEKYLRMTETPRLQVRRRLLGFVGYLTCHQQYQSEKQLLQERWSRLEAPPPFPLRANTHDRPPMYVAPGEVPKRRVLPEETTAFLEDIGVFLRKYQLMHLATWDLPCPQGPLADMPLETARCLLGPNESVSTLPAYYDVPSSQDVRQETRDQQEHAAKHAGLEGNYPLSGLAGRGDQQSIYEEAFRLWMIEQTGISRYGKLYGLAARLVAAFCDLLTCSPERVKQIRKLYLPFLPSSSRTD